MSKFIAVMRPVPNQAPGDPVEQYPTVINIEAIDVIKPDLDRSGIVEVYLRGEPTAIVVFAEFVVLVAALHEDKPVALVETSHPDADVVGVPEREE